ncbi:Sulfate/thiosulfate import ATP-binding protein CysA [Falsiruegeria litorea R37]|uniref:Sulfate/thiosulfate import ATP-binding protein CysA n=1 Tax=Falsiruegeria litorea R37 TaxID=1200284 RepID=A0A1Y5S0X3_9RHOB|nr:molybdenum ABC transporter ATP-binding protein [Falsiruegeria litorea]SLN30116.1 Sulfate/thiosulfate import ATP-binding protein CysA [Falsiruegeria litorea R37]
MSLCLTIKHQLADFALDVSFEAPRGITALFGASGTGKTSVVNAVSGLLKPDQGRIILDGEPIFDTAMKINIPPHKRRLGYVFQDGRLFPHLSVRQNLMYGARFAPPDAAGPTFDEVIELLGIAPLLDRRPGPLSGGEKQRVAIGRALLSHPRMLLMDEPLAALDSARKEEILPFLEKLREQTDIPTLYVSHSVAEVARLATSVVMLDNGRVTQAGPAEKVLSDPATVRQLGLREAGSILPATVHFHHPDGLTELSVSGGRLFLPKIDQAEGSATRVRILAHDIMVAGSYPKDISALNILPGEITSLRQGSGPGMIVQIKCGDDFILARITRRSAESMSLKPGAHVHAVIKAVAVARVDVATR